LGAARAVGALPRLGGRTEVGLQVGDRGGPAGGHRGQALLGAGGATARDPHHRTVPAGRVQTHRPPPAEDPLVRPLRTDPRLPPALRVQPHPASPHRTRHSGSLTVRGPGTGNPARTGAPGTGSEPSSGPPPHPRPREPNQVPVRPPAPGARPAGPSGRHPAPP